MTRARIANSNYQNDSDNTILDIPFGTGATGDDIIKSQSAVDGNVFSSPNIKSGDEFRSEYFKNRALLSKILLWLIPIAIGSFVGLFGWYIAYYSRPIASIETDVSNLKEQSRDLGDKVENIQNTNTKNSLQLENIEKSVNK